MIKIRNKKPIVRIILFFYLTIIELLLIIQIFPLLQHIESETSHEIVYSVLSQVIIFGLIPMFLLVHIIGDDARIIDTFKLKKGLNIKTIIILIGFALFAIYLGNFLNAVFIVIMEKFGFSIQSKQHEETFTFLDFTRNIILTCCFPALFEEITHRGMLFGYMSREYTVKKSIFYSSLFFSLMHMNMPQLVFTFILGYFIAIAVVATKSFWAGVFIHFLNNALVVIKQHLMGAYAFDENYKLFLETAGGRLFSILKFILLAVIMIFGTLYIFRLYRNNERNHEIESIFTNIKELKIIQKKNKLILLINITALLLINIMFALLIYG